MELGKSGAPTTGSESREGPFFTTLKKHTHSTSGVQYAAVHFQVAAATLQIQTSPPHTVNDHPLFFF
jgi:hypothetical protein